MTVNQLIMHCGAFAEEHGVNELLDALAGIHLHFTELSPPGSPSRMAYEMVGMTVAEKPKPQTVN